MVLIGNASTGADLSCYDITAELKDGTVVKQANSAGSWGIGYENFDYVKTILFKSPVDINEFAGVRIKDRYG